MPPSVVHLYRWVGENFEERIWNKLKCYWEDPWEAHWEHGEHMGTSWEHNFFLNSILTAPLCKGKKDEPFSVYILLFHWLHAYSIGRHGCCHFVGLTNTPSTKHTIHIMCPNLMVWGSLSTHLHLLNSHLIILWKLITNYCLNLRRCACHYGSNT
jgi:hypothetical protein